MTNKEWKGRIHQLCIAENLDLKVKSKITTYAIINNNTLCGRIVSKHNSKTKNGERIYKTALFLTHHDKEPIALYTTIKGRYISFNDTMDQIINNNKSLLSDYGLSVFTDHKSLNSDSWKWAFYDVGLYLIQIF